MYHFFRIVVFYLLSQLVGGFLCWSCKSCVRGVGLPSLAHALGIVRRVGRGLWRALARLYCLCSRLVARRASRGRWT